MGLPKRSPKRSAMRARLSRVMATGLVAAVVTATPALAHVTVQPGEGQQGSFFKLTFRTPNERDDAGTVKLEVKLPAEHPFAFLNVRPVDGWTYAVERTTLDEPFEVFGTEYTEAVTKLTWEGGTINPGEFQEFEVSVGPLPDDTDLLLFPAVQTYSSGEVVRWIDEDEEGEQPAPRLRLVPADEEGTDGAEVAAGASAEAELASDMASDDDVDGARGLAMVGLAVGALGLVAGLAALARGRRASEGTAS